MKIIEIMTAIYLTAISVITLGCIRNVFGYTFSGCASDWWIWEFRPLWIIPVVLLIGLIIVITATEPLIQRKVKE